MLVNSVRAEAIVSMGDLNTDIDSVDDRLTNWIAFLERVKKTIFTNKGPEGNIEADSEGEDLNDEPTGRADQNCLLAVMVTNSLLFHSRSHRRHLNILRLSEHWNSKSHSQVL